MKKIKKTIILLLLATSGVLYPHFSLADVPLRGIDDGTAKTYTVTTDEDSWYGNPSNPKKDSAWRRILYTAERPHGSIYSPYYPQEWGPYRDCSAFKYVDCRDIKFCGCYQCRKYRYYSGVVN